MSSPSPATGASGSDMPGKQPPLEGKMPIMNAVQLSLIVAPTVLYAVATLAVIGRIYARRLKAQAFGLDDALSLLALIFGYVQQVTVLILVLGSGLALPLLTLSLPTIQQFAKVLLANVVVYITTIATLQLAVLAFYIRLFKVDRRFRIACYVLIGLVAAWGLEGVLARIFACGANVGQALENIHAEIPGTCPNERATCASTAISHVILDASILLMPVPMIWKLQMSTFNKWVVTLVLCSGVFATVCAVLRMHCMINLYSENPQDPTMVVGMSALYQSLETPIGIICICTPTFAPLWAQLGESRFGVYVRRLLPTTRTSQHTAGQTTQAYRSKETYHEIYTAENQSGPPSDADMKEAHIDTYPSRGYLSPGVPYGGQEQAHGRIEVVSHWVVERD